MLPLAIFVSLSMVLQLLHSSPTPTQKAGYLNLAVSSTSAESSPRWYAATGLK